MIEVDKIIQTLDLEDGCKGTFCDGKFEFGEKSKQALESPFAWSHSPAFEEDKEKIYINLFLQGKRLQDYSSDPASYNNTLKALRGQKEAAKTAKVDISKLCFYDIIPDHLLYRWFSLRDSAMKSMLKALPKPAHYDILHKIHVVTSNISNQKINVSGADCKVEYDIFSSATGRLSTKKGSYPILNVSKQERSSIRPQNDMFLELDLNGAEIRTLLAFSGVEQPKEDIHVWNMKDLPPWVERSEAKEKFFAWLYNPSSKNKNYEKFYNKKVYLDYFKDDTIITPFGRVLPVDERRALNYLLQSTTSDIVLESAYNMLPILKGKRSKIAFTMHDSVVLDFAKEDYKIVEALKTIFEDNLFGRFSSTISIGKNFGDLKEISI